MLKKEKKKECPTGMYNAEVHSIILWQFRYESEQKAYAHVHVCMYMFCDIHMQIMEQNS